MTKDFLELIKAINQTIKHFFELPYQGKITTRTLSKLVISSLKLLPIAILAQIMGMVSFLAMFWEGDVERTVLLVWCVSTLVQIYLYLHFTRKFWVDRQRVQNIRFWIARWTWIAVFSGVVWGVAGHLFLEPYSGAYSVVTAVIVVAVSFATWPVFSCWIPALTAYTGLCLAPLVLTLAFQYGISETIIALAFIALIGFILYSGRRLNELTLSSVLNDAENHRLVSRLKKEINLTQQARRKTEAESERRARFFAAANHDLRQPLQAMAIYLDILKRHSSKQTAPVIAQLGATGDTISTLVSQILEVSRMEFGAIDVDLKRVFIPIFFEEIQSEFEPLAAEKNLIFKVKSVSATIVTDSLLLKRVLNNLITNALRYSNVAGGEVVLGAREMGPGKITIGVYDCGPGLSKEEREKIFEPFFRGVVPQEEKTTGFGLGLSIVRGICEQLNIPLTVGSKLGRGSVFRLTFDRAETTQVDLFERDLSSFEGTRSIKGTIVLVEDDTTLKNAMVSLLESWGATVLSTDQPNRAFYETCLSKREDILLMLSDFNLRHSTDNGLEVAAQLMKTMGREIPCIVLSAVARDVIEKQYKETHNKSAECVPSVLPLILQKPISGFELNQAIYTQIKA